VPSPRWDARSSASPRRPDLPDAVFVEDAAVVLDEIAVITRTGCGVGEGRKRQRRCGALPLYRELCHVLAPGTIDGGDVLQVERTIFVGRSGRTNAEGIDQLRLAVGLSVTRSCPSVLAAACT